MNTNQKLQWVWLASEVLLVATSIATIFMLSRIFVDNSFAAPLIFTAFVAHGVLIAMRWFGFGSATSALMSLLATASAVVAIHYSSSALAAIVPTSSTIEQFRIDMNQAGDLFASLQAPVPPVTGFLVVSSLGLWLIAFATDWAAFRVFAPGQALVPYIGMLVFVSLLGTNEERLSTTATALVCGVLFLLAHRSAARAADGVWLDQGPGRGYLSLMIAGGIVALIAAAIGILGGPSVPGADSAPLVEIGDENRQENKPLEVISPLVQIQPRLTELSDQVMFTVRTNQRSYWRVAALDVFDGALWRSQGQYRSADDQLPVGYPSDAPVDLVRQTFEIAGINQVWAPAAYLPTAFENHGTTGVNYEGESATFIVDTNDNDVADGLSYTVTSQVPSFTGEMLTRLAAQTDEQVDSRYLNLPDDYSPLARSTAESLTAGMTDPYQKAYALQQYFQENFAYDIDVAKGHDIRRLEDFLEVKRGYCEQFAGTYASMARSIGLPARVAIGYTQGDQDPTDPNRYIVRGKHAHAWPEVFISGAGWVSFEPTPGRGAPNASDYTGLPEAQDSFSAESPQTEEAEAVPEDAASAQDAVPPTPTPVPDQAQELEQPVQPEEPEMVPAVAESSSNLIRNIFLGVAAVLLWVFGIPALKRRRRRRHAARVGTDPRRLTTLAWAASVDLLEDHGAPPFETESLHEYAERVQRELPATHPAFGELTILTITAAYRSTPPTAEQADTAQNLAITIRKALEAETSWPERSMREIDPRPLLSFSDPVGELAERLASGATA